MEAYKKRFARTLADTGALFFDKDLILKDGRPTPYFVNMAMFKTGRLSLNLLAIFFLVKNIIKGLNVCVKIVVEAFNHFV
jgi:orotate phosphoribosyltransferase